MKSDDTLPILQTAYGRYCLLIAPAAVVSSLFFGPMVVVGALAGLVATYWFLKAADMLDG